MIVAYQILKYRFSFTVTKQENSNNIFLITYEEALLLEFSFFISVNYVYFFKKNTTELLLH